MTIDKQFAQDGAPLDDCMESLLEVLAELLEESQYPAATGKDNQDGAAGTTELRSGDDRAIHVVVNDHKK